MHVGSSVSVYVSMSVFAPFEYAYMVTQHNHWVCIYEYNIHIIYQTLITHRMFQLFHIIRKRTL